MYLHVNKPQINIQIVRENFDDKFMNPTNILCKTLINFKRFCVDGDGTSGRVLAPVCLDEKQKNIERTKKYAGDQDVEWWGNFFNH